MRRKEKNPIFLILIPLWLKIVRTFARFFLEPEGKRERANHPPMQPAFTAHDTSRSSLPPLPGGEPVEINTQQIKTHAPVPSFSVTEDSTSLLKNQ